MNLIYPRSDSFYVFLLIILYSSTTCQSFYIAGDDLENFPFQVVITGGKVDCVGVVLNKYHILTSARCLSGFLPSLYGSNWTVVAGDSSRTSTKETDQRQEIFKIIVHKYYGYSSTRRQSTYDISVAILRNALVYNTHVQPVTLPDKKFNETLGPATASGWGIHMRSNESFPDVFGSTLVSVVLNYDCEPVYGRGSCFYNGLSDHLICAEGAQNSFNARHAEGLLFVTRGNIRTLIGILTLQWGLNNTAIYIRVTKFLDWIDSIPNLLCPQGEYYMDICRFCVCSEETGSTRCSPIGCDSGPTKQSLPLVPEVRDSIFEKYFKMLSLAFEMIGKVTVFTR